MKKIILVFAALIVLASCNEENDIVYSVHPDLAPAVEAFYSDASAAGIDLPSNLIADVKATQAVTSFYVTNGQNHLYFNGNLIQTYSAEQIQKNVYHALGGMMLKKNINVAEQSLSEMKAILFQ